MSENEIESLDAQLDMFQEQTGIWPPGRDRPAVMGGEDIGEIRWQAWHYWCRTRAELARLRGIEEAYNNSPDGILPCRECGRPVICPADGRGAFCNECWSKENEGASEEG